MHIVKLQQVMAKDGVHLVPEGYVLRKHGKKHLHLHRNTAAWSQQTEEN
jgi:hypothetical protein